MIAAHCVSIVVFCCLYVKGITPAFPLGIDSRCTVVLPTDPGEGSNVRRRWG